ncbi:hypothetical protein [Methylobacterium sp. Leaf85]|uniref:hypothetical protein n=1 Tax=Methylobacterium sp. Leaf85 TaxID=1736241 RepID=UPI0012E82493|nr:hypothetical protein [Methylobacterium sp. Leaf85]
MIAIITFVSASVFVSPSNAVVDVDGSYVRVDDHSRELIERFVVNKLRDPVAAQVRNLHTKSSSRGIVLCGELNAKNGYNAYTGFEAFAVVSHQNGKHSTYNPSMYDPEFRPIMRKTVLEHGCGLTDNDTRPKSPPNSLIQAYYAENEVCRGGAGDEPSTLEACGRREDVSHKLKSAGYCYGREGEAGYQESWHVCGPRSNRR